jgi:hypothetical protein
LRRCSVRTSRPIGDYITLLNQDTLLSVEVLKAANSAAFAAPPTTSLREAVMRIGLSRVQSILMLRASEFADSQERRGAAAGGAAPRSLTVDCRPCRTPAATDGAVDSRFVRGMLLHVEHMVILGAIGDVSRERQAVIMPSSQRCIRPSGVRPQIREALTASWKLDQILGGLEIGHEAYLELRRTVVSQWVGRDLPQSKDGPGAARVW